MNKVELIFDEIISIE